MAFNLCLGALVSSLLRVNASTFPINAVELQMKRARMMLNKLDKTMPILNCSVSKPFYSRHSSLVIDHYAKPYLQFTRKQTSRSRHTYIFIMAAEPRLITITLSYTYMREIKDKKSKINY